MIKRNRNYLLHVQLRSGELLKIGLPFTVEFDIHRNSLNSANVGQIRIYNLSTRHRNQIRKDQFAYSDQRRIFFFAGYGDKLSLAFTGNITQAWSVREGNNMITQIESFDGGMAYVNSTTQASFYKNTPQSSIIDTFIQNLPGVKRGAVGNYTGSISRGNTYSGDTTQLLYELTGGGFFIDNGKANCLKDNEYIQTGDIPLINAATGLLGTPVREQTYINFDMLFEPNLRIAQLIQLESETADLSAGFNGHHKVISLKHRGVISDAVSGQAVTSVGLLPGVFTPVRESA